MYTCNCDPTLIDAALAQGIGGYLSKTTSARDLVAAWRAVHAGRVVVSPAQRRSTRTGTDVNWPRQSEGLTDRDAEVRALIT